ncbi:hypothetical protein O181_108174 [Austropuccinia psidii MF-1]|uniref:Uncharacterized protein n=1 Tax=Austropuccinia psidii MF-1 TaxID=1389203 RepID=A0A9Q3PNQ2_9BASI|nr:hypothetical protein [Austropuccinia psidii MF-1]
MEPSKVASDTALTPPYAFSHLPLTILTLVQCPPNMPPMPPHTILILNAPAAPSRQDYNTAPHLLPHHSFRLCTPASSSLMIKILMLLWGPQHMPPTPPSTLLMPPPTCLILSTPYHAYSNVLYP